MIQEQVNNRRKRISSAFQSKILGSSCEARGITSLQFVLVGDGQLGQGPRWQPWKGVDISPSPGPTPQGTTYSPSSKNRKTGQVEVTVPMERLLDALHILSY